MMRIFAILAVTVLAIAAPSQVVAQVPFGPEAIEHSVWDTTYTAVNGQRINAVITFEGDRGHYDIPGGRGQLYGIQYFPERDTRGNFALSIRGQWSLGSSHGTFQLFTRSDQGPLRLTGDWEMSDGSARGDWNGRFRGLMGQGQGGGGPVGGGDPKPPAKICHLIVVADTLDTRIGDDVRIDADNITDVFRKNVVPQQLEVTRVTGRDVTIEGVLGRIENYRLASRDTLIVFFAGHGAYERGGRGQYLSTRSGELDRSRLIAAMHRKNARLSVLLTDTCSNYVGGHGAAPAVEYEVLPAETSPGFVALCWKPEGFVDLSATKPGEIAIGDGAMGGFFTSQLCAHLREVKDREPSWPEVAREVGRRVDQLFRDRYPRPEGYRNSALGPDFVQYTQTVYPNIRLADGGGGGNGGGGNGGGANGGGGSMNGGGGGGQPFRFGVAVRDGDSRGVVISQVVEGPATRVQMLSSGQTGRLEERDIITHINGRPIRSEHDYANAVDTSGRTMRLTVISWRDGRRIELQAQLNY